MDLIMPILFVLGIAAITLEDTLKINKSAVALLMCIALWLTLIFSGQSLIADAGNTDFRTYIDNEQLADLPITKQLQHYLVEGAFIPHLGDVAQTLFFVMCTMFIVRIIDKHGGFRAVANLIATTSKRRLLWNLSLSSFFFSALLDNLAAAIVLLAILRKLVPDATDRMKYACMIVITANAGGAWSPIGDVTTLLLWTGGNITAGHQMATLILPALVNMLLPLSVAHYWLFRKGAKLRVPSELSADDEYARQIPLSSRIVIFFIGILSLVSVPFFQTFTHLPAFMCVLFGLVFLWIYTDAMYGKLTEIHESEKLRISRIFHSVDLPTIFFFLGILMSVAALDTGGQLTRFAHVLDANIQNPYATSFLIGVASSLVDNVALVAATMGMYPVAEAAEATAMQAQYFMADGGFWTFLAYCAVTGGSILIIGSATGVTIMGAEKIGFGYYLKRFTPLALLGYAGGAIVYLWINS